MKKNLVNNLVNLATVVSLSERYDNDVLSVIEVNPNYVDLDNIEVGWDNNIRISDDAELFSNTVYTYTVNAKPISEHKYPAYNTPIWEYYNDTDYLIPYTYYHGFKVGKMVYFKSLQAVIDHIRDCEFIPNFGDGCIKIYALSNDGVTHDLAMTF